jgi:hypothetical protein
MYVVHEANVRSAQPQRRQERDPVDHLEHDIGVGNQAAGHGHDRGGKYRRPASETVDLHSVQLLLGAAAGISGGDHRHAVVGGEELFDLAVEIVTRPAGFWVGPVPVGQNEDVHGAG